MTTVLQELSLNAYRGVSGLVLENLTPVSLVVGANNSGKSSILEAAGLFLRPPDPTQWVNAVRHRDVDMSLVDGLWSVFPSSEALHPDDGPQESNPFIIEGSASGSLRRVEARCFASQMLGTTETAALSARVEVSVNGDPALTLKFPSPAAVAHQVPMYRVFTVTPATHYSTKALVEHLSRVVDEGKKQLAVELLQIFDKDVEDLDGPEAIGVVLDSDDEPADQRFAKLKTALEAVKLPAPSSLGQVSDGRPRVGVFALPEPGAAGTLEDVLLALGDTAYPELCAAARGYADQWRQKVDAEPTTSDWKELRKPAGAKKATIGAMTAVLKPGKSTQVSLEDNRWVSEQTKALACLQPSLAFLSALLTTPAPPATVSVQDPGEAS